MELVFLTLLIVLMATALGSGFPVAFSLPGSAILTIGAAAFCGWLFDGWFGKIESHSLITTDIDD